MTLPELILQHAHLNGIMILVIVEQDIPLHTLALESEFLIRANGSLVEGVHLKLDSMQVTDAEAVVQHKQ